MCPTVRVERPKTGTRTQNPPNESFTLQKAFSARWPEPRLPNTETSRAAGKLTQIALRLTKLHSKTLRFNISPTVNRNMKTLHAARIIQAGCQHRDALNKNPPLNLSKSRVKVQIFTVHVDTAH